MSLADMHERLSGSEFDHEAIHLWFELSYAPYLVIARSILQSMPDDWQKKFVLLLEELRAEAWKHDILAIEPRYYVTARDDKGKFVPDPFRDYERGRRRVF